jgi:hypothetical protein
VVVPRGAQPRLVVPREAQPRWVVPHRAQSRSQTCFLQTHVSLENEWLRIHGTERDVNTHENIVTY